MSRSKIIYLLLCFILIGVIVFRFIWLKSNLEFEYGPMVLTGEVVKEPDIRETKTKLTVKTEDKKVLVTIDRYPTYNYGDRLKIKGELEEPVVLESFNYQNYLLKDGITAVIYYPEIEVLKEGSGLMSFLLKFKDRIREKIYENFSPPHSELLGAMMLGDKGRMSLDFKEKLNKVGIRHITAVSGLHILILSTIVASGLSFLGKKKSFYFTLLIISLFILMIGFPASAIRAGIMSSLVLLSSMVGRLSSGLRSLILAGLVMLVFNPLLLIYDIGFQLSFLAAFGIIYLSPFIKRGFPFKGGDILASTFSAYIFTMPILIYNFGEISFIGPLANLLIIPVIYWIMLLGFLFALVSFLGFGWLISLPLYVLLAYVVEITGLLFLI